MMNNTFLSSISNIEIPSEISQWPLGNYYDFFTKPSTPLITSFVYFVTVHLLNPKKGEKRKPYVSGPLFTALVLLHNVFLCVFSLATFINATPAVFAWFGQHKDDYMTGWCDRKEGLWNSSLHYWTYLFYVSKYYEIVDTIIILLKGKHTSFLQSFHHAGAILSMWLCLVSHSTPSWVFVVFNSFIHTIMYFYYSLSTVGISFPGKFLITYSQITQFLVGDPTALTYLFIKNCQRDPNFTTTNTPGHYWYENQKFATAFTTVYVFALVFLFADFAKKAYGGKSSGVKKVKGN